MTSASSGESVSFRLASCSTREEADALAVGQRPCRARAWRSLPASGSSCRLVEDLRRVAADLRVQPPRPLHEEPAVRRHDGRAIQQMRQGAPLGAARVRALEWLVQLLRVAEQHERVRGRATPPRALASENWPASSMKRTSTLPMALSLAQSQAVPPHDVDAAHRRAPPEQPRRRLRLVAPSAQVTMPSSPGFWPTRTARLGDSGCSGRRREHLVEQLADDLVAVRRHPDLPARGDEVEDHARPAPGLARARRTLDGQGGPVEPCHACRRAAVERATPRARAAARPARARRCAARRRMSRSRAARYGPSPSMPCSSTERPMSRRRCSWALVGHDARRDERRAGGRSPGRP